MAESNQEFVTFNRIVELYEEEIGRQDDPVIVTGAATLEFVEPAKKTKDYPKDIMTNTRPCFFCLFQTTSGEILQRTPLVIPDVKDLTGDRINSYEQICSTLSSIENSLRSILKKTLGKHAGRIMLSLRQQQSMHPLLLRNRELIISAVQMTVDSVQAASIPIMLTFCAELVARACENVGFAAGIQLKTLLLLKNTQAE